MKAAAVVVVAQAVVLIQVQALAHLVQQAALTQNQVVKNKDLRQQLQKIAEKELHIY